VKHKLVKTILRILPLIFGVFFLLLIILSVKIMVSSPLSAVEEPEGQPVRQYHYTFYLPATDSSFFRKLKLGAMDAAEALDCALTFHSSDGGTDDLEMAPYSGVDGLAVYLHSKDSHMSDIFNSITTADIPIVQIENSIDLNDKTFFIGTNGFEVGKAIGDLITRSPKTGNDVLLVYSQKNPGLRSDSSLIELGLKSADEKRPLNIRTTLTTLNPLDAEKITYNFLSREPRPDFIVLTDPRDTLVTVQTIVDLNLVGSVQIIGFGEDENIREYMDKGILLGSIVRNPYRIGYSTVMALKEISQSGYTSAFVDTGINVILSPLLKDQP